MAAHRARKRFGQHFLTDPAAVDAILRAISARGEDTIVEIGPGHGALTHDLARLAGTLHVVELDRDLAAALRVRYATEDAVIVHEHDALTFDFSSLGDRLRIAGNLPYNISTPLLFHLLKFRERIVDMHVMLQKEVVDRIAAAPGSKAYGRLSIMLGCYLHAEPLFDVAPDAFDPPPAVTSSVLRLDPIAGGAYDIADERTLSTLVSTAFMQRRKTIRNSLRKIADTAQLKAAGIDPALRAEQIGIAEYVALSNQLAKSMR